MYIYIHVIYYGLYTSIYIRLHILYIYIYISYLAAASLNVSLRLKEIQTRCIQLTCTPSLPQRHNKRFSRMYM